jgi:SAM-dependent methyltransferase
MSVSEPRVGLPGTDGDLIFWFDRLSLFDRRLHAAGWVVARSNESKVRSVSLSFGGKRTVRLTSFGKDSPDLALHYGAHASSNRFDETIELDAEAAAFCDPVLNVSFGDGSITEIKNLSLQCASLDPVHKLTLKFLEGVRQKTAGTILEIGSRHRVGASLRAHIPNEWKFLGLDILPGENVDVVGDAHELSRLFAPGSFDAVMSMAVFEHLLMPWKVVIELNRVMRIGGLGYIGVPQAWPVHEEPWDYWRYSVYAWPALFNRATGFEIVEAQQGEKASLVAERIHPGINFDSNAACYLASAVFFRKVAETSLDWPVDLRNVVETNYPL